MAHKRNDRCGNVSTSSGTSDFTLGAALTAHRSISSVVSTGDTFPYLIVAVDGAGAETGEWETGYGTYNGADVFSRTSVHVNSDGTSSALNFAAGTKRVYLTYTAREINGNVRYSIGAPTSSLLTGLTVRADKPLAGTLYLDGAALANTYTWAGRPSPTASIAGAIITATDIAGGTDFVCKSIDSGVTYRWFPLAGRVRMSTVTNQAFSGTVTEGAVYSVVIPAGLLFPGCEVRTASLWRFNSTNPGLVTIKHRFGGASATDGLLHAGNVSVSSPTVGQRVEGAVYIESNILQTTLVPGGGTLSGSGITSSDNGVATSAYNVSSLDITVRFTCLLSSNQNTAWLKAASIDLIFPG